MGKAAAKAKDPNCATCWRISDEIEAANNLPDVDTRASKLRGLKRRALRIGCEIAALNALFHLEVILLARGDGPLLKKLRKEIDSLETRPSVRQIRELPMTPEVAAGMRRLEKKH